MSLLDYKPLSRPVVVGGKELFEVRGLGVAEITYLLDLHREDIIHAATAYQEQRASVFSTKGLEQMTLTLLTKFPTLTAEVISCAAGHRDKAGAEAAAKLPFGTAAATLADILTLTFDDAGGLKNLLATLAKLTGDLLPAELKGAVLESLRQVALSTTSPSSTSTAEQTPHS